MKSMLFVIFMSIICCFAKGGKTVDENNDSKKDTVIISSIPKLADSLNLFNITADLASPEMKGRLTGTKFGKMAEKYVESRIKGLNLDFQTQQVTFPLYELLTPTKFNLIDENGNVEKEFEYIKDYREVDFTGTGNLIGELVYVGYGLDSSGISPYEKIDVKGKIAVILSGIPEGYGREWARLDKKIDAAVKNGATATIIIPTGRMAQYVAQRGDEAEMFATDLRRNPHFEILHNEAPSIFLRKDAVIKLLGESDSLLVKNTIPRELNKKVELELHAINHKEAESKNIFGVLHGSDPELSKEVIVIGAHYDHLGVGADGRIYYGATDNAAGTAVVLEVAKYFSELKEKPKRTIVFALWTGEEQGLHGSNYYVNKSPILPLEHTKLMIQVDYLGKEYGPFLSNVDDKEIIQKFAGTPIKEKTLQVIDWGGRCASDDCPFIAKGIPAYRFISYGEHHHTKEDTIEILNVKMLSEVSDIIIDGLKKVAF